MNILPKKRWHVRNQDNKERVRRDEENARLEEKKEQDRISIAEKEAHISLLRSKRLASDTDTNQSLTPVSQGHIRLFSREEEAGCSLVKDNVDYIKEKHEEKETYEKKIGLLQYVGQSSREAKDEGRLWYTDKRKKVEEQDSDLEVDSHKKSKLDPMVIVEQHMKNKKSKKHSKKKKKKKEKEKRINTTSIEMLREERLKREKIERQKTVDLLGGKVTHSSDAEIGNDRRKYFNQYNPDVSRKGRDYE